MCPISFDFFSIGQQIVQDELGDKQQKVRKTLWSAIMHQEATPSQDGQATLEVFLAHTVEDKIQPVGFGILDDINKILRVIVDGCR